MTTDVNEAANFYFSTLSNALNSIDIESLRAMVRVLKQAYADGNTVYVCGNGGSAATSSHIVCDFNKGISLHHDQKFRFQSLNDNVATMMAISNDLSYDDVFFVQVQGRLNPGDVLIAISGSGNSKNVIKVAEYFRDCGNCVIGLTGYDGGKLKEISSVSVHVPVNDMQKSEDSHMIVLHMVAQIIAGDLGKPLC